ncbi:MAG: hypothetical protein JWN94_290 [Betaproteobacteria bacterium]|nr:hypothetical protein [Betaproteobacteria bacterium]
MPAPAMSGKAPERAAHRKCARGLFSNADNCRMLNPREIAGEKKQMKTGITCAIVGAVALMAHFALAQQPPERVLGLMKSVVVPASDVVFAVGKGAPKKESDWAAVENGASRLIDAGKTLATEGPATGGADWIRLANSMSQAAVVAGSAAKNRNVDAVLDAGDVLYTTCEDCHRQYMKK